MREATDNHAQEDKTQESENTNYEPAVDDCCFIVFLLVVRGILNQSELFIKVLFGVEACSSEGKETDLDEDHAQPSDWLCKSTHEFNISNADDKTQ